MANRVSGLISGMDTEQLVTAMVSNYKTKVDKYTKNQTKLSWTQDAWKDLNKKVYGLYTNISSLRYSGAYSLKKANSSNSAKATVSASGEAVNGTQKLNVLSLAQSAYFTGAKLQSTDGSKITSDTKLSSLGYVNRYSSNSIDKLDENGDPVLDDEGNPVKEEQKILKASGINVTTKDKDGREVTTRIDVTESTTIHDITKKLSEIGLNANFDAGTGRFFVSSKETGSQGDFSITAADKDSMGALKALGFMDSSKYQAGSSMRYSGDGDMSASSKLSEIGYLSEPTTFQVTAADGTISTINVDQNTTMEELIDKFREAGVNASFDASTRSFIMTAEDGSSNFKITADSSDGNSAKALEMLGLNKLDGTNNENVSAMLGGSDAKIILNGITYTGSTNTFLINGLTINATGVTGEGEDNAISITTESDVQAVYDKIKDFLTEYNNVINEITKLYNAESAGDYKPLTDEEKEAMSETEIEKWEDKIKSALLRRDTTLNGVQQAMMSAMSGVITINGTKLSLVNFGIHTMGYLNAAENEQNAYHIDGDADDENTSGNKDKLMEAITSDPEQVVEFFKQLTTNLYDSIGDKMKSTNLSSAYTIYNDKQMKTQYNDFSKLIKEWEKKMTAKEDSYYKKFSTMESKLAELQSQTSSLGGLLGGSN